MSRRLLSTLATAAVLLAAAPALANEGDHASAAAPVATVASAPATATAKPGPSTEALAKKLQELEARLVQAEAKVAEATQHHGPTVTPPDSHGESW